ncbi:hypothetical protein NMY22_g15613 [Coprinellus aureogranulatus]|nr:hypothetical protein NMY22_g15613 [Coprinellus aureogranulatus]
MVIASEAGFGSTDWDAATAPYSHLFLTNDAPSEHEIALILQQIDALKAAILDSPSARENLETFLWLHYSVLSPVRRVPPEVLGEIFAHITDSKDLANASLISRAWRATSLLAPTDCHIQFKTEYGIPCTRIRSWLARVERSACKKLELSQASYCGCTGSPPSQCAWVDPTFLALLHDLCLGSVQLTLDVNSAYCIRDLGEAIHSESTSAQSALTSESLSSSWDTLRSLKVRLQWENKRTPDAQEAFKSVFKHLPTALEDLTISLLLRSPPFDPVPWVIPIPTPLSKSITALTLDCPYVWPFHLPHLLRQFVNVDILHLNAHFLEQWDIGDEEFTGVSRDEVTVLPSIRTLVLRSLFQENATVVLQRLRLPSLIHLTIESPLFYLNWPGELKWVMDDLRLLVDASQRDRVPHVRLRSFTITGNDKLPSSSSIDAQSVAYTLAGLPYLETLSLRNVFFDVEEFVRLITSDLASPVLPRLKGLELRALDKAFQTRAFLEYLKLRASQFREVANPDCRSGRDKLMWVKIQYREWSEETKANWEDCFDTIQKLRSDFGVVVERTVSEAEWTESGRSSGR